MPPYMESFAIVYLLPLSIVILFAVPFHFPRPRKALEQASRCSDHRHAGDDFTRHPCVGRNHITLVASHECMEWGPHPT